jgi:hypothetical protein
MIWMRYIAPSVAKKQIIIGTIVLAMIVSPVVAHDIYKDWRQPDNPNVSCCNDKDCRPTRAYLTDEGWRAWNGQVWLLIPKERVLPTDYAGDGRSHLCESSGHVYCFSPGQPRG